MSRPPLGSTLDVFGISIQWYSLLMVAAVCVGIVLATREEKRLALPQDTILDFALLAIPLGVIGARLYYVAFTWNRFSGNLLDIFRIWNGGLAIYGAVLGGLVAIFIIARRKNISAGTLMDAVVPSLAIGQAIGRWGNYANMEAFGARIYNEAAQFFPLAVEIPIVARDGNVFWYWHMATFFYEFVWDMIVFALLMRNRKHVRKPGDVTLFYLLLYCAGRTVVEGLREDSLLLNISGAQIRISQVVSALVCMFVLVTFITRLYKTRGLRIIDWLACIGAVLGIVCTFVGEFERNAYQMLFMVAQYVTIAMLAVDLTLVSLLRGKKRMQTPMVLAAAGALLCAITLLFGMGRLGGDNTAYIALRQTVSMLHVVFSGYLLYLRCVPRMKLLRPDEARTEGVPCTQET